MSLSYHDLVAAARRHIREIDAGDLAARLGPGMVVIDVREPHEVLTGTVPGAIAVPRGVLGSSIASVVPDPGTEVVLICSAGNRSALAAVELQDLGYRRVWSLAGGLGAWRAAGGAQALPAGGSAARYARHLVLPGVGAPGQERLRRARVVVVGAGGLGSPVVLYLAAAGVGTLGIVDDDVVDLSNLQRQVLHATAALGRPKTASAAAAVAALNPEVAVHPMARRLVADNAAALLDGYDLVVDGTDTFEARYAINDAAVALGIPLVTGAVLRWEGQVFVAIPRRGPCYRCLFPEPPPADLAPDCAVAGVFGAVPGVIGSLMAVEAAKLLLGAGESLAGRLVVYDGWEGRFTEVAVRRDPACPACR